MSKKWWLNNQKGVNEMESYYNPRTMYQKLHGFDKFVWGVAIFNAIMTVLGLVMMFLGGLSALVPEL